MCLCDLPTELLPSKLSYVSIFDYMSIRGVCKCWREAFLKCPTWVIGKNQNDQWFVLLRGENLQSEHEGFNRPSLYATGKIGNLFTGGSIYSLNNVAQLCGTRFLLSRHRWLLLFSSSQLFFFHPFSRATTILPLLNVSMLGYPTFEISAPPTSSECTVFAISCGYGRIEINICHRGEFAWTRRVYENVSHLGVVSNAVFVNGVFYCLHHGGFFSCFDAGNSEWRYIGFLEHEKSSRDDGPLVSYAVKSKTSDQVVLYVHSGTGYAIVLEEPLNFDGVASDYWHDLDIIRDNELKLRFALNGKLILKVGDWFKLSSFNIHAWCGSTSTTGNNKKKKATFHWHRFTSFVDHRKDTECQKLPIHTGNKRHEL